MLLAGRETQIVIELTKCTLIPLLLASKSTHTVATRGENINIKWSPNGNTIAVGNKEDLLTFVDSRTYKIISEEQFKYEV